MTVVAFDLDGTLITAEAKQTLALRSAARVFGVEVDPSSVWQHKRNGLSNHEHLLGLGLQEQVAGQICEHFQREIENAFWLSLDVKFPDTDACLDSLRSAGFKLILLTARSRPLWLPQQLRRLRLDKYFDHIFTVKPYSAASEKGALIRVHQAVVFVGDSESDFEAAKLAGVEFSAVCTGQRSGPFLLGAGVDIAYGSLTEAVGAVLRESSG